jgi:hypothetical protein
MEQLKRREKPGSPNLNEGERRGREREGGRETQKDTGLWD